MEHLINRGGWEHWWCQKASLSKQKENRVFKRFLLGDGSYTRRRYSLVAELLTQGVGNILQLDTGAYVIPGEYPDAELWRSSSSCPGLPDLSNFLKKTFFWKAVPFPYVFKFDRMLLKIKSFPPPIFRLKKESKGWLFPLFSTY